MIWACDTNVLVNRIQVQFSFEAPLVYYEHAAGRAIAHRTRGCGFKSQSGTCNWKAYCVKMITLVIYNILAASAASLTA